MIRKVKSQICKMVNDNEGRQSIGFGVFIHFSLKYSDSNKSRGFSGESNNKWLK